MNLDRKTEKYPDLNKRVDSNATRDVIIISRSFLLALLIPVAFVFGLGAGYLFWGMRDGTQTSNVQENLIGNSGATQSAGNVQDDYRFDVQVDDDPSLGPLDAPVTIIEFSDYECPYCRKWYYEVFPKLWATYSGKVRLVYRDFPLVSIHANAGPAAEAANCAGEQGAYWEFHDKIFSMELGFGSSIYESYAKELNLDNTAFVKCLDSRRYQSEVQADLEYGTKLGIRSTPTFFINGIPIVGAQPWSVFQEVIEKELAGEIP